MFRPTLNPIAAVCLIAGLAACGGSDYDDPPSHNAPPSAPPVMVGDTVALTASNKLVSFNRATPATLVGSIGVSGLAANESLLGIDVRPADGQLYALGSGGNVYTVNPSTGTATLKATLRAAAGDDDPFAMLAGSDFAVDFNPVADRLRVVGNSGQNLRIHVDTGDTITDGVITAPGGAASITAAGYTNAFAGTTTTQLFDLDLTSALLHAQDPPNNGTLGAGLPLGVTGTAVNGFDVDARTNTGYAALAVSAVATLHTVNLATGAATAVGAIGGTEAIKGLALMQPAAPSVIGLTHDNRLIAFDPKAPNTLTSTLAITGLSGGESVLGIDIRPQDGLLYALSSAAKLYTIDPTSGAATLRATLSADAADTTAPFAALNGTAFSVDFNPAADRLRVISNSGQNLRIVVGTGATTTDGDINRAGIAPVVLAAAYTNSFAGAASTTLFNLEAASDVLTQQNPPNNGTLLDTGALGVALDAQAAFDIAGGANGLALAAVPAAGGSGPSLLYGVSLTTGAATLYRNTSGDAAASRIGGAGGPALRDLAIRF